MKIKILGLTLIGLLAVLAGCQNSFDDQSQENQKSGKLTVKLTDAPFPADSVKEANITINKVSLKMKSANSDEENDSTVFVMMEKDTTLNLLDLSNGITTVLAEMELPTGEYDEIRLNISDAQIVLNDGRTFDLKVPSGNSSGLKIKINPSLLIFEGEDANVLLDFDVSRSFKAIGNDHSKKGIKGFHFKPVIRAVNEDNSGAVSGVVTDTTATILQSAEINLISGADTISSAISNDVGYYAIIGVPEGTYKLTCNLEGYLEQAFPNVVVKAGKITEKNFKLVAQ